MTDRVTAVFDYARKRFGAEPEYLWGKYPNYAVLRNKTNQKWYAVIMDVKKESLEMPGSGKVWIMNVKCDPMMIGSFTARNGFFPAYHMNKEHWISVDIDNRDISFEDILSALDMSYEIVNKSKK